MEQPRRRDVVIYMHFLRWVFIDKEWCVHLPKEEPKSISEAIHQEDVYRESRSRDYVLLLVIRLRNNEVIKPARVIVI